MPKIRNIAGMLYSRIKLFIHLLLNTNRYKLSMKMKQYLRSNECLLQEKDKAAMLQFLSYNLISQISYPFVKKYHYRKVKPIFDSTNSMHYILHHGKKLYFKKSWSKEKICSMYNWLCSEQDLNSPHSYWNFPLQYRTDDIAVDAGAAEGIWALDMVDKVNFLYLFEYDEEWTEALTLTFAPWKDKVTIVDYCISEMIEIRKSH
jgi:hypothetical protein